MSEVPRRGKIALQRECHKRRKSPQPQDPGEDIHTAVVEVIGHHATQEDECGGTRGAEGENVEQVGSVVELCDHEMLAAAAGEGLLGVQRTYVL